MTTGDMVFHFACLIDKLYDAYPALWGYGHIYNILYTFKMAGCLGAPVGGAIILI